MVYLVPAQYVLIQLQLINRFFKQFNKREGSWLQYGVTVHSSIIIFACFIYFKSLSVFSLRLFRAFLYSLSRNGAMFQTVLTFELPKLIFSCCDGCGFTSRSLQIGTISFIMLCNILILKCENMERLSRNFQLFSSFRNFQAIFAPLNSYFTEYSRWVPLSFVKIVVFSEDHHMIQDRNGPIINLDASARSVSRIFLCHQRFFLFENVYFFSFLFFSKRWGGGKQGPAPAWALISYCVSNNASVVYFF